MRTILVGSEGYWGSILKRNLQNSKKVEKLLYADISMDMSLANRLNEVPDINSVIIATPSASHSALAIQALQADKHILVEKPMTLSGKDARQLGHIAKERDLKIGIDHTFLFDTYVRTMKNIIDSGKIGRVLRIKSIRANLGKFQSGGVIWDLAPHDIALANYLLGSEYKVEQVLGSSHLDPNTLDTADIYMTYGKAVYSLHLSWLYPTKVREFIVIGTEGMIKYDMLSSEPLVLYDKIAANRNDGWVHSYGWKSVYEGSTKEPIAVLIDEFADWVDGRSDSFVSPISMGIDVVECIEKINSKLEEI